MTYPRQAAAGISALFKRDESSVEVKLGYCKQIQELQPEYKQVL